MSRTIRNFKLLEQIGSGGMGVIWRAVQLSLDRQVALKELHPHIASDREFITRFEREAKSAASLEHENIVGVIDFGQEGDGWFIAMELVDGPDLRSLLDKEPRVPGPVAISIALDVLRGLEAAHQRGIVHRDMKPANILLTKDGVAKVADFSVAQSSTTPTVTATGAMLGTPAYMSPEQASGQQTLDGRSDVFAVGSILYEILTGKKAFDGPTYPSILSAVLHGEPQRLEATDAGVPPSIARVIRKAMEKTLTQRYASAADFARDLEHAATEESVPVSRRIVADWMRDPKGLGESIRRKQSLERLQRGQRLAEKAGEQLDEALAALAAAVALDPTNEDARREYDLFKARAPREAGTVRIPDLHEVRTGESIQAPTRVPEPRPPTDTSYRMQPASFRLVLWGGWMLAAIFLAGMLVGVMRGAGANAVRKRALEIAKNEGAGNAFTWLEDQIDERPEIEASLRETRALLETEMMLRDRSSSRLHDVAWEQTRKYTYPRVPLLAANIIGETNIRGSTLALYKEALKRDPALASDPSILDACIETLHEYPPRRGSYEDMANQLLQNHYPEQRKAFAVANLDGRGAALLNAAAILEGEERLPEWLATLLDYSREQNMVQNETALLQVKGRDAQILSALQAMIDNGDIDQANRPRVREIAKVFAERIAPVTGPSGVVTVRAYPPGKVIVDGTEVAPATPLNEWRLPVGKHTIRVVGADYDSSCDLTVKEDGSHSAHYWPRTKTLSCSF